MLLPIGNQLMSLKEACAVYSALKLVNFFGELKRKKRDLGINLFI